MAVRTNTANGGTTYIDMDIQVVSNDNSQMTLRAVIYLTSLNVSDTSNNCHVDGQWSRDGALNLGGVYNAAPVWFQDVSFAKTSSDQLIGWNLSWSGINYWGVTLSGTAYYTIPRAITVPSAPYGYSARNITTTTAYTTGVNVADNGGAAFNNLWVQWGPNASMAGAVDRQMGSFTDGYMDGIAPGSTCYFRVAAANGTYWSAWGAVASFATAPAQPAAPTVTPTSGTTATAAMTFSGNAIDQVVYRVYNSGGTAVIDYFSTLGTTPTTYALTGLTPGASYTIGVFTHTSAGYSAESTRTAFTMPNVPGAPTGVTVDQITGTTARISWVPPASNGGAAITQYGVFVATNPSFGAGTIVYQANHTASPVTIPGLTPGYQYWVVVYAYNMAGYGPQTVIPTFSTLSGTNGLALNVGGVWKDSELWLNDGGVWKLCELWENVGGTWKQVN